jgi:lipopolysaccharide transport system permease protein
VSPESNNQITRIRPESSWFRFDAAELWKYRELLYFLAWRDVKVRYKQTAIGILWAILQPVLTTVIFAVIFSQVARFDSSGQPYALFVLSGLLVWLFVFNAVTFAANSLVGNANLVTKAYFPKLIVPVAATLASAVDLVPGLIVLLALMLAYGTQLSPQIVLAPLFLVLAITLALSIGCLFAALNVRFRDVKFALPFVLQVWMFVSPIFYPRGILPERARQLQDLNPLTGILQGFRASLFNEPLDARLTAIAVVTTLVIFVFSLAVFNRMENDFSDLI